MRPLQSTTDSLSASWSSSGDPALTPAFGVYALLRVRGPKARPTHRLVSLTAAQKAFARQELEQARKAVRGCWQQLSGPKGPEAGQVLLEIAVDTDNTPHQVDDIVTERPFEIESLM